MPTEAMVFFTEPAYAIIEGASSGLLEVCVELSVLTTTEAGVWLDIHDMASELATGMTN